LDRRRSRPAAPCSARAGLAAVDLQHAGLDVVAERDRAAQRHLLRRRSRRAPGAPCRSSEGEVELGGAVDADAARGQVRRQPAVGDRGVDEVGRHAGDEVVLAVEEGEEARLVLLDDVDLDAVDHRQPAAAQPRRSPA
jgi:hypothetical protein